MDKSKDIRFEILSPRNLDIIGDILKALLQSCRTSCIYLEHPRFDRLFPNLIVEFDSELRLSGPKSILRFVIFALACLRLLDLAQAHERRSRRRQGAFSMKLINDDSTIDEVEVSPKRDDRRRAR